VLKKTSVAGQTSRELTLSKAEKKKKKGNRLLGIF
jgi:hypothetical protein